LAGHVTHVAFDAAPTADEFVDAGQAMQLVEPSKSENVPAGQGAQLAALAPPIRARNVPAAQNWSQKALPVSAVQLPAGQPMHVARPVTGAYVPAPHGVGSDEPAGQ